MANECVNFSWCKELLIFRFNMKKGARKREFGWHEIHRSTMGFITGWPWINVPRQSMYGGHRSTLEKLKVDRGMHVVSGWAVLARAEMACGPLWESWKSTVALRDSSKLKDTGRPCRSRKLTVPCCGCCREMPKPVQSVPMVCTEVKSPVDLGFRPKSTGRPIYVKKKKREEFLPFTIFLNPHLSSSPNDQRSSKLHLLSQTP